MGGVVVESTEIRAPVLNFAGFRTSFYSPNLCLFHTYVSKCPWVRKQLLHLWFMSETWKNRGHVRQKISFSYKWSLEVGSLELVKGLDGSLPQCCLQVLSSCQSSNHYICFHDNKKKEGLSLSLLRSFPISPFYTLNCIFVYDFFTVKSVSFLFIIFRFWYNS